MKTTKIFSALLLFLPVFIFGQELNINKIAANYLKDGLKLYDCPARNSYCIFTVSFMETNRTDSDGNKIINLKIIEKENGEEHLYFPDLPEYPLQFYYFKKSDCAPENKPKFDDKGNRIGCDFEFGTPSIILPEKNTIIRNKGNAFRTKAATNKEFSAFEDFLRKDKEKIKKEIIRYLDFTENWVQKKIDKAKTDDYAKLITEFFSKGEKFYLIKDKGLYKLPTFDEFKIIPEKSSQGLITSLKIHFPFSDGKFYDKADFYSTISPDKSLNNLYRIKDEKLMVKDAILIPFEDFIFLYTKTNNRSANVNTANGTELYLQGFISRELTHPLISKLSQSSRGFADREGTHTHTSYDFGVSEYEEWKRTKTLSTKYDENEDILLLEPFIKKYFNALIYKK
jgi:hypothetical protein